MPTPTADAAAAAAVSSWSDLPLDLLHDVSHRLHTAAEYVFLHAVCKPWRDTLLSAPRSSALLPWLVTPPDALGRRTARCVFNTSRAGDGRCWLLRAEDCTAASRLTNSTCVVGDPLARYAGAAPLPPIFSGDDDEIKWRAEPANHAIGTVSGDGTIVLCLFRLIERTYNQQTRFSLSFSILRPGDTAWTSVGKSLKTTASHGRGRCSIAYHGGKIVLCFGRAAFCIAATPSSSIAKDSSHGTWWVPGPHIRSGYELESTYVFELSGELLCAIVEVRSLIFRPVSELADDDISVSVYALREVEPGKPRWVKRDGMSFAERMLFLGLPTSFAVDTARFAISDSCAYFVVRGSPSGWFRIGTVKTCFLFKYSFCEDKLELVEMLPEEWDSHACMWLTPLPAIAPTDVPRT